MTQKHFKFESDGGPGLHPKSPQEEKVKINILQMNGLSPMSVKMKLDDEGKEVTKLFFLDFIAERVYNAAGEEDTGFVGEAILEILVAKKNSFQPQIPEAVAQMQAQRKVMEQKHVGSQ